jgi:hypothetical protein
MPQRAKFVAVVEPNKKSRNTFAEEHEIPESMRFETPEAFFSKTFGTSKIADAAVIATL